MSQTGAAFTVSRAHGYRFRTPLSDESGRSGRTNYLVRLDIDGPDGGFLAVGESQPRGAETGDTGPSWQVLMSCLRALSGTRFEVVDRESALATVQSVMDGLRASAARVRPDRGPTARPLRAAIRSAAKKAAVMTGRLDAERKFRGTMLGVEAALLDAAARVLGISVTELLNGGGEPVTAITRLRGSSDLEANFDILRHAPITHAPVWLDLNGSLKPEEARQFVEKVAHLAASGELPKNLLLEQPVGLRHRDQLPALQRLATSAAADVEVQIMAGGRSFWGAQSLHRLVHQGGAGAYDLRPAAAGGIAAGVDLARAVKERAPEALLVLSNVEGAGEIGRRQFQALAAAIPGADFAHSEEPVPAVEPPVGPGLGVSMPYDSVLDTITEHEAFPPEPEPEVPGPQPNVYEEVTYLQPLGPNGTKGHLLERQALALGLQTRRFSKGAFVATDGVHDPLLIKWSRSPLSSAVSLALCTHKEATRIRLNQAGVPVPRGRTFVNGDFDSARAFADRIGFPVVVKPAMGVRGIGVVANIQNRDELDQAFTQLTASKLGDQDVIVEKHIPGNDYRIVVVGDEVIAAILREPGSVVGDGKRTVAELMMHKNLRRRLNPHLWGRPIMYDDAARYQLERVQMTLDSVPPKGQRVMLSNSNSLSQGGDSTDVLDEMHPSIKEAAVKAVKAVPGLAFCGVDFLIEDHTKPLAEQVAGICELNAHAAIGNCEYPLYGKPRQVAKAFMDECVERFGLVTAPEHAETLSLKLTIRGRVNNVGYREWMQRQAETFGLRGWVRNVNSRTVEAVICGDTEPASALAAAAVLGPRRALPTSVSTTHIDPVAAESFIIRHDRRRWAIRG